MQQRDAEKSKQRILLAAEREFADKGFFGARVDVIAATAQINKRMIYAYFGDKEGLYQQVLTQVYHRMEDVERELVAQQYRGKRLIQEIIGAYFDFLENNPAFVSILMWENLNQGRYLKEMESSRIERSTIRYFVEELERGRQDGTFCRDIDPWHTAMSMITTCYANFSNRHTLSKLFRADLADSSIIEQRKQHTTDLMLAYVCRKTEED